MKKILETERLMLREMTQNDYAALAEIIQDDETMYAYEGAYSAAETQEWLDRNLLRYAEDGFGLWAVILKSNGRMIGQTGITWQLVEGERVPEIGYLFNRAFWHNGYATEAVIACREYAFDKLGFTEIFSIVRSTNIASKDVAVRNGMIIRKRITRHFRGVEMPHFVLSATNPPHLETMSDFFTIQAPAYDEYMLENVAGLADSYIEFSKYLPGQMDTLLDLGCGTGLELTEIYKRYPDVQVTGIDLTQAMLDKLSEKFGDKDITLVCASYLDYDFGNGKYDCAVSFETMHHLTYEEKLSIYENIYRAIKPGGRYVEGDYMVETQDEEGSLFAKREEYRDGQKEPNGELYHFDTPLTIENQIKLFAAAGFINVKKVWREGNTTIIVGEKA